MKYKKQLVSLYSGVWTEIECKNCGAQLDHEFLGE